MVSLHPAIIDWERHLLTCDTCSKRFKDKDQTIQYCKTGQKLFDDLPKSRFDK